MNKNNIVFYQAPSGKIPVLDFLSSIPKKLAAKALRDIELLEKFGSSLREPNVKAIQGKENHGLFELRIKYSSDSARIFYFIVDGDTYVLLHGFLKKSNKTPKKEIEIARKYMQDYKKRQQKQD